MSGGSSPDGYPYRIDSYIVHATHAIGRQLTQVTVVVRDGNAPASTLARLTSTFDQTAAS